MAVEAVALNEEFADEKARWYLPEGMIRHEGDADPGSLRVLRAHGDSMEPLISDGCWSTSRGAPPEPGRWRCSGTAPGSWSNASR